MSNSSAVTLGEIAGRFATVLPPVLLPREGKKRYLGQLPM